MIDVLLRRGRARVARIFPNKESWLEEHRYLNMQLITEHKRG